MTAAGDALIDSPFGWSAFYSQKNKKADVIRRRKNLELEIQNHHIK